MNCPECEYWFSCLSPLTAARRRLAEMIPSALRPIPLSSPQFPVKTTVYYSLILYVPDHLLQSIQAGQRLFILLLLNVALSPPLHIDNWPWHCRRPLLVVPFPFAAMNTNFWTTCHTCQHKGNFILRLSHWAEASKCWVTLKELHCIFPCSSHIRKNSKRLNSNSNCWHSFDIDLLSLDNKADTFIAVIASVVR